MTQKHAVHFNRVLFMFYHLFLFRVRAHPDAQHGAAHAADDVSQVGNVVRTGEPLIDLTADVDDEHKDQRQGNAAGAHSAQRGHQDHHKDDAAGAQQRRIGEQQPLEQAGDEGGDDDGLQQCAAAVALLQRGAQHQHQRDIAGIVGKAAVAQHVQEKAGIGQQLLQGRAVNAEKFHGGRAPGGDADDQHHKGNDGEVQRRRGVVLYQPVLIVIVKEKI